MATTGYKWFFGDGTISTEKSPIHIYRMPGKYKVRLEIYDDYCGTIIVETYVYVYDVGFSGDFDVSKTNLCLRHAIPQKPGQGKGWSIYNGDDWPMPIGSVGTREIVTTNNERRQLVIDCNTFNTYWLGKDDHWQDGANEDYAGSEIESEILFPEHTPPIGATAKLKHSQYHLWLKPWFKTRRNTGDYDRNGFRSGHNVDMFMRSDSSPDDAVVAKLVPKDGQIVFDRHIISPSLQPGARIRVAPWRLAKAQMWYTQQDTAAAPPQKLMSESDWGRLLSEPVFWVSRGFNPILNLCTGADVNGSYTGLAEGPDGYGRSAVVMAAGDSIWDALIQDLDGDFCALIWIKNPTTPITLFQFSTGALQIRIDATDRIIFDDGVTSVEIEHDYNFADWTMIGVQRNGENVEIYANGTLLQTARLTDDAIVYGGTVTVFNGVGAWYDSRILPWKISADAMEYYYNDMKENKGDSVCPIF